MFSRYCTAMQCRVSIVLQWGVGIVLHCRVGMLLYLYLNERRGLQENTSIQSWEFLRAQPKGTPKTECWYFPVDTP